MKGIILLSISILLVVSCQGEFYISTAKSHWSDASSHCTMATPSVTYRPKGHLDISGIDIPDKESLWIGYYTAVRVFEYLDCVKLGDFAMDKQLKTFNISGSPSQCFPGCGNTSIIGVTLSKCFCIGENYEMKRSMEKTCTTPCLHPRGTACGLENKNGSYLSVYRVNENGTRFPETVQIDKEENNCLVFNRTYKYFVWKNCSQLFEVGCDSGDLVINVKEGKTSWFEATNKCFQQRLYPTSYERSKTVRNYSKPSLWTGVIKSQLIHKHAEIIDGVSLYGDPMFGVLTKTSKGYLVKFERDSKKRRILCQRRTPSKENSNNTFIVIGIILTVVAAVVFVVGISYQKRKMPKLQKKMRHIASPDYSYAEISLSNGPEESHQPDNYYILEPHAREMPPSDVTNNDVIHLNDNIADISDRRNCDMKGSDTTNEYDKLGTKHLEEKRNSDNVYNRLYVRNDERGIRTDNVYNSLDIRNGE